MNIMVTILFIIIGIFILLLAWLVFGPITIRIDTDHHEYSLNMVHLLTISPQWDEQGFRFLFQFPFYQFKLDPQEKTKPKIKKTKGKTKKGGIKLNKIWSVLKSFKVRQFALSLDTDDYCLNALIFPVFHQLTVMGLQIKVNFQGENYCLMVIRNNLWRMGISYLKASN